MGSDNLQHNSKPSTPKRSKRNKWTFWPSFLLLLLTIIALTLLSLFIFIEGLFEKVSAIVPILWGAFTTFIAFLGIKKAKEITWLRLFKLLPTGMIIIFYSIVNILLIVYFILAGVIEHKIYISSTLDDKPRRMIDILWEGEHQEYTGPDGSLLNPVITTSGTYKVTAIFGSLNHPKDVKVSWLWPFEQHLKIPLFSSGKVLIQSRIGAEIVNGVNIFIEKTGGVFHTPDTLVLSSGEHTLKAEITRNGKIYKGDRTLEINAGPNPDIIIELSEVDCLPKTLIINAEYNGNVINKYVNVVINKDTLKRKLPATLSGLKDKEFDIEVLYTYSGYLFKGTTTQPISLNCGETKSINISLN